MALPLPALLPADADRAAPRGEAPGRTRGDARSQTRQRLLAVGRQAFARKGLAGVNLKDDILVPAGVSVGSFYHQFRDKTDLFVEILRAHSETFRAMIQQAHRAERGGPPAEIARQSFATVLRVAEENDDLFRIMARERESADPRVHEYLRDSQRRWIAGLANDYRAMGLIDRPGLAELAAQLITALTVGTVLAFLDLSPGERAKQRRRLIDGLVQFTLGGVPGLAGAAGPAARRSRKRSPVSSPTRAANPAARRMRRAATRVR